MGQAVGWRHACDRGASGSLRSTDARADTEPFDCVSRLLRFAIEKFRRPSCGILLILGLAGLGCAPAGQSYRAGIQSERPTDRIRAIYKAGESRDSLAVPLLVDRLEDEDEGVRLYAFLALEKITGKRFDYDYAAPLPERARAVDRWRTYVRERVAAGVSSGRADEEIGNYLATPERRGVE